MIERRAEILIERMRQYAVRHQWVFVVGARAGEDQMGKITRLIMRLARHRFSLMHARPRFDAGVELPQSFVSRPTRAVEMDRNIDAVILHPLKAADGLAKDHAGTGVFVGHLE